MSYEKNRQNIAKAAQWMREQHCDLWITATRERSDPAVRSIFGSVVVGTGLYVVTAQGEAYLVANRIDIQEGRDSGVFDESIPYSGNFDEVTKELLVRFGTGKKVCINHSLSNPTADGMRLGFWKRLQKLLPEGWEVCSSEALYSLLNLE